MSESATLTRPAPIGAPSQGSAPRHERMRCLNCGQIAALTQTRRDPACPACGNAGFRQP